MIIGLYLMTNNSPFPAENVAVVQENNVMVCFYSRKKYIRYAQKHSPTTIYNAGPKSVSMDAKQSVSAATSLLSLCYIALDFMSVVMKLYV